MPQDEQTRWLNDALAGVKRSAFFMGKAMVRRAFFLFPCIDGVALFAERRSVLASRFRFFMIVFRSELAVDDVRRETKKTGEAREGGEKKKRVE